MSSKCLGVKWKIYSIFGIFIDMFEAENLMKSSSCYLAGINVVFVVFASF